jgi:hypothetical protein
MKKIGFIVLAIVLAIGLLGVAYAQWISTFTVNGSVQMGTVVVGVYDDGSQGTPDYSGFGPVGNGYYAGVNESFTNAYPEETLTFHIWLGNLGTLPVKFEMAVTDPGNSFGIFAGHSLSGTVGGVTITDDTDLSKVNAALAGLAATDQGGHVDVNLTMKLGSDTDIDQQTFQGQTGTLQVTVTGTEFH